MMILNKLIAQKFKNPKTLKRSLGFPVKVIRIPAVLPYYVNNLLHSTKVIKTG